LTASFRGDRIARRVEDGPAALAGAVTGVRDGGDRLEAGAGERRCGGGPRRASPTLRQRAWAAAHQRRDSPATRAVYGGNPFAGLTLPLSEPCAHARLRPGPDGPARRRRAI
jgi:hypothetical protein